MSAHSSESGDLRSTAAALLALTAVRLAFAALTPLTEDEAYYRLWSFHPALGYFDHPPMIAWMIWLGRQIAGDTSLGVRLVPTLFTGVTGLAAFDLARACGLDERIASRAAIWLNATFLVGAGGLLAVPDVPTTLFWTLTLSCALRAVSASPGWWVGAGVAAGLACLSKYSALFLAPGVLVWLAATPQGRRALASPWPWLAAAISAAVFAPNVAWNAAHDWVTFAKQFGRARFEGFAPRYLVKLLLDQALLLNPLIAFFVVRAVARRTLAPLLLTSAPFALYLAIHALHAEVQGQWPAPLYPPLVVCAAAAAEPVASWRAALRAATPWVGLSAAAAALIFFAVPVPSLPFRDPARSERGWAAFAAAVGRERAASGAGWIGAADYAVAAQLTAMGAPTIEIYERERYAFEPPGQRGRVSGPGLVILAPRDPGETALRACFAEVTELGPINRGGGAGPTQYLAFRVAHPRRDIIDVGCVKPPT